jgi:hypothetical protein
MRDQRFAAREPQPVLGEHAVPEERLAGKMPAPEARRAD